MLAEGLRLTGFERSLQNRGIEMKFTNVVVAAALAVAMSFGAVAPAAAAARAIVTTELNVRAGPGVQYHVVGKLYRGDRVRIRRCTQSGRWCFVDRRHGRDGWVSARYLRVSDPGYPGGPSRPGSICFYGPLGYICVSG